MLLDLTAATSRGISFRDRDFSLHCPSDRSESGVASALFDNDYTGPLPVLIDCHDGRVYCPSVVTVLVAAWHEKSKSR